MMRSLSIAFIWLISFTFFFTLPIHAETGLVDQICKLETLLYGKSSPSNSIPNRVNKLWKSVFPKKESSIFSISEKVLKLNSALEENGLTQPNRNKSNKYTEFLEQTTKEFKRKWNPDFSKSYNFGRIIDVYPDGHLYLTPSGDSDPEDITVGMKTLLKLMNQSKFDFSYISKPGKQRYLLAKFAMPMLGSNDYKHLDVNLYLREARLIGVLPSYDFQKDLLISSSHIQIDNPSICLSKKYKDLSKSLIEKMKVKWKPELFKDEPLDLQNRFFADRGTITFSILNNQFTDPEVAESGFGEHHDDSAAIAAVKFALKSETASEYASGTRFVVSFSSWNSNQDDIMISVFDSNNHLGTIERIYFKRENMLSFQKFHEDRLDSTQTRSRISSNQPENDSELNPFSDLDEEGQSFNSKDNQRQVKPTRKTLSNRKPKLLAYKRQCLDLILSSWDPERFTHYSLTKKTVFDLSVDSSGNVSDVTIAEASGNQSFDNAVIRACKLAAPFPKPPPFLTENHRLRFSFEARVINAYTYFLKAMRNLKKGDSLGAIVQIKEALKLKSNTSRFWGCLAVAEKLNWDEWRRIGYRKYRYSKPTYLRNFKIALKMGAQSKVLPVLYKAKRLYQNENNTKGVYHMSNLINEVKSIISRF